MDSVVKAFKKSVIEVGGSELNDLIRIDSGFFSNGKGKLKVENAVGGLVLEGSMVGAYFTVDLLDPGTDNQNNGKLTLGELFDKKNTIDKILGAELLVAADLNLHLAASFAGAASFPRVRTDFGLDWQFVKGFAAFGSEDANKDGILQKSEDKNSNGILDVGEDANSNGVLDLGEDRNKNNVLDTDPGLVAPEIRFDNVQLNLGEFFTQFLGDTLGEIQRFLEPIQPIIDLLTLEIPVLSDIAGSPVTFVDLAKMFGSAEVSAFLDAVILVNDLVNTVALVDDPSGELWIDIGAFSLDGLGILSGTKAADPNKTKTMSMDEVNAQIGSKAGAGGQEFTEKTTKKAKKDRKFFFPIIEDPSSAFGLLLGEPVDLILFDIPRMELDFVYEQVIRAPPPLSMLALTINRAGQPVRRLRGRLRHLRHSEIHRHR